MGARVEIGPRWWHDDPDWERQRYEQMIVQWNEKRESNDIVATCEARYQDLPDAIVRQHHGLEEARPASFYGYHYYGDDRFAGAPYMSIKRS